MVDGHRITALALAVGLLLVGAAAVDARAPPRPACGVCTDALDDAAAAHGVELERGSTELHIRLHANVSTTWTARIVLEEGTDRLRDDSRRSRIVRAARERSRAVAEAVALDSHLDGNVLVVSYRDPGAAERHLGVVVFTRFQATDPWLPMVGGGEGTVHPGVDRMHLSAPQGHVIVGRYDATDRSRTALRWTDDPRAGIDRSTRVTAVPRNAWLRWLRSTYARWLSGL